MGEVVETCLQVQQRIRLSGVVDKNPQGVVKEGMQVKHNSFIKELWIFFCGCKG